MGSRTTARRRWVAWLFGVLALGVAAVWGWGVDSAAAVRGGGTQDRYAAAGRRQGTTFARAEQILGELQAIPDDQRTKAEYDRALDGFRAVYHTSPVDLHAAEAVYDVAQLLAEEGRAARDAGLLRAAVAQYEFLRRQYPGSSWRVPALLREGDLEAGDLGDTAGGRARWQQLLREYPGSAAAAEARLRLSGDVAATPGVKAPSPTPSGADAGISPVWQRAAPEGSGSAFAGPAAAEAAAVPTPLAQGGESSRHKEAMAAVTGVRHWSTSTYTRVAIDLGGEVEYQAVRVTGPDRIYFDLQGTRLAPELVGKTFAVTDDGFLKRIRAAQFSDNMTRVVLDVHDVTEYSAFLLPNPYRLIIDIHGAKRVASGAGASSAAAPVVRRSPAASSADAVMDVPAGTGAAAPAEVPAPATARVVTPTAAKPVPNTVTLPATATTAEVAKVSEQPGRMEATVVPTSEPVAQVVRKGRNTGGRVQATGDSGVAVTTVQTMASNSLPAPVLPAKKGRKTRVTVADGRVVGVPAMVSTPGEPARAAVPTSDGQTSLVRALGLKVGRIVIDAGHGGHDSGTLGVDGIEEKDVVLDVALRLGKLLHERLGAEVIYTRSDDTFIPLETRTAIANKAQADLFLSVHANSSSDASARGVETYYLNFTTDPTALDVAARENAVSNQSVGQLSDLVKKIALKDKIAESREFAGDVEDSLYAGLERGNAGLKDRGVKKAPFVVLIGANMPSVLAEISFVTNPRDAHELREPEYRERVAESLYRGVAKYEAGLSGGEPKQGNGLVYAGTGSGR